jgi:hypothetical protein
MVFSLTLPLLTTQQPSLVSEREGEKTNETSAECDESRGVKRKSYAPRREADSKRNFLFVNCPREEE